MTTPRILFFADAGPAVGGGHVMRCLTLAQALMGQGAQCAFAATPEATRLLETFASPDIERLPIPEGTAARQAAPVADLARTWGAQAAVLDHYGAGPGEEVMIRTGVHRLLVLDDLKRGHLCDLVLDSNLDRTAADYPSVESLTGPAYALVRPEFAALRAETLARRRSEKVSESFIGLSDIPAVGGRPINDSDTFSATATPRRLLIALGLTDLGGITARVVEAILPVLEHVGTDPSHLKIRSSPRRRGPRGARLDRADGLMGVAASGVAPSPLGPRLRGDERKIRSIKSQLALGDLHADIVLGQGAPSLSILTPLTSSDRRLTLHVDTREMAALTAAADLAIGAGGSSVWERCCLGLPTLTLILADNQREAANALAARGAAEVLETGEGVSAGRLAAAFTALLADPPRLAAMGAAAAALCDGLGAGRVAQRLLDVL